MGNIVGIMSTVILVSTLVTLVFAVIAYIGARRPQAKSKATKHAGDYQVPARNLTPALPEEFVLRMHDVHNITTSEAPGTKTPKPAPRADRPTFATLAPPTDKPPSIFKSAKPMPAKISPLAPRPTQTKPPPSQGST